MTRLLTLLFVAYAAVAPAIANDDPPATLDLFDEAVWLFAKEFCETPPPERDQLGQIRFTVRAFVDDDDVVRAQYAGRTQCGWYPIGADAPNVRWPDVIDISVPEGDTRPLPLIALDNGAGIYARGTCTDLLRPPGYGRFHGIEFRLMATVDDDGILRTVAMREVYCDWYPLVSGSG